MKRFGCLAYVTVQRRTGPKFGVTGRRTVLVGYTLTGYTLLKPETGKFYESRDVRFNERLVYKDVYKNNSIKDWQTVDENIDKTKWLMEFEEESDKTKETEGETTETVDTTEIKGTEGEKPIKRGRGRPRKKKRTNRITATCSYGKNKERSNYIQRVYSNSQKRRMVEGSTGRIIFNV